jgi:hypothetical protein
MGKLIERETAAPTSALDLIIEKGINPTGGRLSKLISDLTEVPTGDHGPGSAQAPFKDSASGFGQPVGWWSGCTRDSSTRRNVLIT